MQYFVGSLVTIITLMFCARLFSKKIEKPNFSILHSQSRMFDMISPVLRLLPSEKRELNSQSSKHFDKINYRILFIDSEAYWIKDNSVYVAPIVDGHIDESSAKIVDTMGMNSVQLKKMIFIVDKLTEGKKNDSGTTGN